MCCFADVRIRVQLQALGALDPGSHMEISAHSNHGPGTPLVLAHDAAEATPHRYALRVSAHGSIAIMPTLQQTSAECMEFEFINPLPDVLVCCLCLR